MQEAQVEQAKDHVVLELWTKDVIKKDQDGIRKSLLKLDYNIHQNAVQCLMHAEKHGDTSLMRRLLVDIVDDKTGYRRQGVIAWMKKFSPMELKGKDTIALTGTLADGVTKKPFRVEEANKSPFTGLAEAAERVSKPVYRETLISKIKLAIKEFNAAQENTVNGKAVDKTKPFLDAIHQDKLSDFFGSLEGKVVELDAFRDNTLETRKAQEALRKAELEAAEIAKAS